MKTPDELTKVDAADATIGYIYGYPLVLMDATRRTMLQRQDPDDPPNYKSNTFTHSTTFPTPSDKDVIRVNMDTLYSNAWLDLKEEPLVLTVPELPSSNPYFMLPMLDAWTNVFCSPGTRTVTDTGDPYMGPGDYLITGPKWKGPKPDGIIAVNSSPTDMAWIIGRIQCSGTDESITDVKQIQDGLTLTQLSDWDNADHQNVSRGHARLQMPRSVNVSDSTNDDTTLTPPEIVAAMDSSDFFKKLSELMVDNPPALSDPYEDIVLLQLAAIGVKPGNYDPALNGSTAVATGVSEARAFLDTNANAPPGPPPPYGWTMSVDDIGDFKNNYSLRAIVARIGLGANLPEDAVYPNSSTDLDGNDYNSANKYVLHFDKDELPPVNELAFWSITMYTAKGYLVPNSCPVTNSDLPGRYKLGNKGPAPDMKYNADGSLDIYIQANNPSDDPSEVNDPSEDKSRNWLPTPTDGTDFALTARLYWPDPTSVLNKEGDWHMPGVLLVE